MQKGSEFQVLSRSFRQNHTHLWFNWGSCQLLAKICLVLVMACRETVKKRACYLKAKCFKTVLNTVLQSVDNEQGLMSVSWQSVAESESFALLLYGLGNKLLLNICMLDINNEIVKMNILSLMIHSCRTTNAFNITNSVLSKKEEENRK